VRIVQLATIASGLFFGDICAAGLYSDSLARCLISNTSATDKTNLVRWVFATMALHPAVSDLSPALSESKKDELSRMTGTLFERLLTDDCRTETQEALMYEGPLAMQTSFEVLGQAAMQGLMTHSSVIAGLSDLNKYIDETKLLELAQSESDSTN
jgi:hypothetical protein